MTLSSSLIVRPATMGVLTQIFNVFYQIAGAQQTGSIFFFFFSARSARQPHGPSQLVLGVLFPGKGPALRRIDVALNYVGFG